MFKKCLTYLLSAWMIFSSSAAVLAEETVVSPVVPESAWQYLEQRTSSDWGIIARSLAGRTIAPSLADTVHVSLQQGFREGFSSITQFERSLLALIKLEESPIVYERQNLISLLAEDEYLYHEGLDGASLALLVYQAIAYYDVEVDASLRNAPAAIIDYIISSQQREGGFAISAGRKPDVRVTALALTALAAYRNTPYVNAAVEKGLGWLSDNQNQDASYSDAEGINDCITTATVLTAIRTCGVAVDDPRFVKNELNLKMALAHFLTSENTYRPNDEATATVEATEHAIIALYADYYGMSPYLHPAAYPGYVSPPPVEEAPISPESSMWKFFGKFFIMLTVVYLLLMLTIQIGKYAERKKLPGSLADERRKQLKAEADVPLDFNIPMKAQVPDFDSMDERETGLSSNHHKSEKSKELL